MADIQLNIFENFPVGHNLGLFDQLNGNGYLNLQAVYISGSISFNTCAVLFSASGTTAKTATISFGLYSLTGATLSLANSASVSTAPTANTGLWLTLATSATQYITPGYWYLGFISSTSNNSRQSLFVQGINGAGLSLGANGGPLYRGVFSTTTNAMPASIATSAVSKEGSANRQWVYPYILIAA